MDPYLKDVVFALQDEDPRMVRPKELNAEVQMEAWGVVFQEYIDVWGGLKEDEETCTRANFKLGYSDGDTVDAFVFPCTSACFPGMCQSFPHGAQ
jgi:hypothetical protein